MFRAELFSELCKRARDDEMFNGEKVFSKEEVYQKIAPLCYTTPEQVKSWTLKNSKGPRDLDLATLSMFYPNKGKYKVHNEN